MNDANLPFVSQQVVLKWIYKLLIISTTSIIEINSCMGYRKKITKKEWAFHHSKILVYSIYRSKTKGWKVLYGDLKVCAFWKWVIYFYFQNYELAILFKIIFSLIWSVPSKLNSTLRFTFYKICKRYLSSWLIIFTVRLIHK